MFNLGAFKNVQGAMKKRDFFCTFFFAKYVGPTKEILIHNKSLIKAVMYEYLNLLGKTS